MFDTRQRENDTWILFVFVLRDATRNFTSSSRAIGISLKKNYDLIACLILYVYFKF